MDTKKSQDSGSDETINSSSLGVLFVPLRESHAQEVCDLRNLKALASIAHWTLPYTKNHVLELIKRQRIYLPEYERTYLLYAAGSHELLGEVCVELNQQAKDHVGLQFILNPLATFPLAVLLKEVITYVKKQQNCRKFYSLIPTFQTDLLADFMEIGFKQEAYMRNSIFICDKWEDEIYLGLL